MNGKFHIGLAFLAATATLLATSGDAATRDDRTIKLDDDAIRVCAEGGGCALITRHALEHLRDAAMSCRSRNST